MPIHPSNVPSMDGRHMSPFFFPPDYKIYLLNKRLQERPDEGDNHWWDAFATEFFEEKATFTFSFCLEDGPKRYTIGRTLIPRFFRTMFESGVVDMYFVLRFAKDYSNASTITMDCDSTSMVMHHTKPIPTKVCAEGHLIVDFSADEYMRIRSWHFAIRNHLEYIPKQYPLQNPHQLEEMCKNVTRQGLTSAMLNYLKMCVIFEPMKELMSRQKTYNMEPHDCLRNCLFQKWQKMLNPPVDNVRPPRAGGKRPSKKGSSHPSGGSNKKKAFPQPDVLMVGEPTLMGSDFGEEDERMITRLENNQFSNPIHVKSEDHETNSTFPNLNISPSTAPGTPQQWQQQAQQQANQVNPGAVKTEAAVAPSPIPAASPLVTSS